MTNLPEPLRVVLRDFCHVEWYEIDELAQLVESGGAKFDVAALEKQIEELLLSGSPPLCEINMLTANEFESGDELRTWLLEIRRRVFGR
ncbi:hypothetical protein [Pseudoxanthomonas mexicana]